MSARGDGGEFRRATGSPATRVPAARQNITAVAPEFYEVLD